MNVEIQRRLWGEGIKEKQEQGILKKKYISDKSLFIVGEGAPLREQSVWCLWTWWNTVCPCKFRLKKEEERTLSTIWFFQFHVCEMCPLILKMLTWIQFFSLPRAFIQHLSFVTCSAVLHGVCSTMSLLTFLLSPYCLSSRFPSNPDHFVIDPIN